jgi:5-methylcytosine-specific restriction endonuclease McrA/predicted kinase
MPKAPDKFKPNWIGKSKPVEKQVHYQGRRERSDKYDTTRWRKLRAYHLARNPLCVDCGKKGITRAAKVLDHIIPHRIDDTIDFFDSTNHQGLCTRCHNSKSAQERKLYDYNAKDSKPEVLLVYGPPGSGKTTWAMNQQCTHLIDMDLIWKEITNLELFDRPKHLLPKIYAEFDRRVNNITELNGNHRVIVITTNMEGSKIKDVMKVYKPRVKRMMLSKEECIERVMKDERRKDKALHIGIVQKWFDKINGEGYAKSHNNS